MSMSRRILLFAAFVQMSACAETIESSDPVKLTLDVSMALFNKEDNQQLGLPTVLVFDSNRICVAKASNREIYGDNFRRQIMDRSSICPKIDLMAVESRIGITLRPTDDLTFMVLTESGEYCTACEPIISEFEKQVLEPMEESYSVILIDIGMTEWFSANK